MDLIVHFVTRSTKISRGRFELQAVPKRTQRLCSMSWLLFPPDFQISIIRGLNRYYRHFVHDEELLFVPPFHGRPFTRTCAEACLWDAPDYMTTRHDLLPAFASSNSPALTAFFKKLLMISDVSRIDLLTELTHIRTGGQPDCDTIHDIYHRLQTMCLITGPEFYESLR